MDWFPTLNDRTGPFYQRIVAALADDVAEGRLRRGQQLPTHRALAKALDLDLTTVTRAYAEARRRGLTEARVGQGTFVAESMAQSRHGTAPWTSFDLSMNLPPQPLDADIEGRIIRGVAAIQSESGFSELLNYREPGGTADERAAAGSWLQSRIRGADGDRLVICPGTQSALLCWLMTRAAPGDVILTESLTYPGMKAAAAVTKVRLVGVPTDDCGILPDALRAACRRHKPKAIYLVPTMHNPTTVTMPPRRREEIAEIIRRNGLFLFEDDAYGALEPGALPLAALIPERTYLAASLSKCMAPGLRVSFVLTPDADCASSLINALRATMQMPVSLMIALVTRWLRDGSADAIVRAIKEEAAARQKLAKQILKAHPFAAHPNSHHIWLQLPKAWGSAEFAAHVQRQGLALAASEHFTVSEPPPHAVRVALGAAASRHELARALEVLATALRTSPSNVRVI